MEPKLSGIAKIRFFVAGAVWAVCATIIMFIPMPFYLEAQVSLDKPIGLIKVFAIYFFIWLLIWGGVYFYARLTKRQATVVSCKRIAFCSVLLLFAAIWIALVAFLAGISIDNFMPLVVLIGKSWIGIAFASVIANFIYFGSSRRRPSVA
jgi:hypothetical protein